MSEANVIFKVKGEELEPKIEPTVVEFFLTRIGDGISLKVKAKEGGMCYCVLSFAPGRPIQLTWSVPPKFGLPLDERGRVKVKED